MKKSWRIMIVVGVLVLAIFVLGIVGHRSRSRRALENYKAELRAKGEKLTLQELLGLRPTNVNTSLAALTNAVAGIGKALHPGLLELRKYVRPGEARVAWRQDRPSWGYPVNSAYPP